MQDKCYTSLGQHIRETLGGSTPRSLRSVWLSWCARPCMRARQARKRDNSTEHRSRNCSDSMVCATVASKEALYNEDAVGGGGLKESQLTRQISSTSMRKCLRLRTPLNNSADGSRLSRQLLTSLARRSPRSRNSDPHFSVLLFPASHVSGKAKRDSCGPKKWIRGAKPMSPKLCLLRGLKKGGRARGPWDPGHHTLLVKVSAIHGERQAEIRTPLPCRSARPWCARWADEDEGAEQVRRRMEPQREEKAEKPKTHTGSKATGGRQSERRAVKAKGHVYTPTALDPAWLHRNASPQSASSTLHGPCRPLPDTQALSKL